MSGAPVRPDVSVIVSAYQAPETLQWVLRGLRRQTVLPAEVLVADDGSNPPLDAAVRAIAADLPFPVIHVWQPDEGFRAARSRNNAIFMASGSILGFLDQDTIPHASWLAAHLSALRPRSVCLARTFPLTEADTRRLNAARIDSGEFEAWQYPHLVRKLKREQLKYRFYALLRRARLPFKPTRPSLSSGNICAWRADLVAVNGFDEAYVGWGQEDDDLGRRLYMARARPVPLLTKALVSHAWHPLRHDDWRAGANLRRYRQPLSSPRCAQGLDRHPHPDVIVRVITAS